MLFVLAVTTCLILTVAIFTIVALQKTFSQKSEKALPPKFEAVSLFAPDEKLLAQINRAEIESDAAKLRESFLSRATNGDLRVLIEARNSDLYDETLNLLTESVDIDGLALFIESNQLSVNAKFVNALRQTWESKPNRKSTARILHFAAISDDAGLFGDVLGRMIELQQTQVLTGLSQTEIFVLAKSHFELLSNESKSSGAGFLLKQKFASK